MIPGAHTPALARRRGHMLGGSIRPASISPGVGGEIHVASTSRGRSSRAPIRRRVGSMATISGEGSGANADAAPASRPQRREEDTVNLFRNYELRTAFAPQERRRLPTTLVTGWLGSGKTTLLHGRTSGDGVVRLAIKALFEGLHNKAAQVGLILSQHKAQGGGGQSMEFAVDASFCEVYEEKVRDLFAAARDAEAAGGKDSV